MAAAAAAVVAAAVVAAAGSPWNKHGRCGQSNGDKCEAFYVVKAPNGSQNYLFKIPIENSKIPIEESKSLLKTLTLTLIKDLDKFANICTHSAIATNMANIRQIRLVTKRIKQLRLR